MAGRWVSATARREITGPWRPIASIWDWHGGVNAEGRANNSIFVREAEEFPIFDRCVSALVDDLHGRPQHLVEGQAKPIAELVG